MLDNRLKQKFTIEDERTIFKTIGAIILFVSGVILIPPNFKNIDALSEVQVNKRSLISDLAQIRGINFQDESFEPLLRHFQNLFYRFDININDIIDFNYNDDLDFELQEAIRSYNLFKRDFEDYLYNSQYSEFTLNQFEELRNKILTYGDSIEGIENILYDLYSIADNEAISSVLKLIILIVTYFSILYITKPPALPANRDTIIQDPKQSNKSES